MEPEERLEFIVATDKAVDRALLGDPETVDGFDFFDRSRDVFHGRVRLEYPDRIQYPNPVVGGQAALVLLVLRAVTAPMRKTGDQDWRQNEQREKTHTRPPG